ncbi:hypothetical protein [Aquimarina pacifica]|uniref:hypothetical protein n=1 Tax=Aquimarina pacifica TaxID=1296415 RepID=UPI00046E60F5|nr:hypothetical protein [Aquimarina pacifica]
MNIARDKLTGEEIEAEELKLLISVEKANYECIDVNCRIRLIPCSFEKHHKPRPYFKTEQGVTHTLECTFSQYTELQNQSRIIDVSVNGLFPVPYPSKLVKPSRKTIKTNKEENDHLNPRIIKNVRGVIDNLQSEERKRNRVVTALGQIVDFYLNFPNNRDNSLEILNIHSEYRFLFKRIKGKSEGQYKGRKIYFGRVSLSDDNVIERENRLFIQLYEFDKWIKNDERNEPKNNYTISIDLIQLSNHKKTKILNELVFATIEQKNDEDEETKKKAYIFFLGDPPKEDTPYLFTVYENYVVCRYDEILRTGRRVRS